MEQRNTKQPREIGTKRFAPSIDRLCKCGHTLGHHTADRTATQQPCLAHDLLGEECDCEKFKRA